MVYTEEVGQRPTWHCQKPWCFCPQKLEKAVTMKILFLSLPVEGSLAKSLVAPGGGHTTKGVDKGGGGVLPVRPTSLLDFFFFFFWIWCYATMPKIPSKPEMPSAWSNTGSPPRQACLSQRQVLQLPFRN